VIEPTAPVKVLLLGSYIFAEEIADLISDSPGLALSGFIENYDPERCKSPLLGKPVHWVDTLPTVGPGNHLLCAIGTTKRRGYVDQVAPYGLPFATLIHPTARLSRTATLGDGCILSVNSIVAAHSTIGSHAIVNRGASVGHHTIVGNYVTISPGALVAGACVVEDGAYIAIGAILIDRVRIGRNSIVAAGAVVTKDVPDNVQVAGVPARIVKENIEGR
jgi:acetyltransferase EpsM